MFAHPMTIAAVDKIGLGGSNDGLAGSTVEGVAEWVFDPRSE